MPAVLKNGRWVFEGEEEEQRLAPQAPIGLTPTQEYDWQQKQQQTQQLQQREAEAAKGGDNRPFWAQDFGQGVSDTGKILANAAVALGTDYLDLAAGVGDVVTQAGSAITGNGWDWNKVMDDSDNPWTQWRRDQFRTETQAGQAVSNLLRIGTGLVALPKFAVKGVVLPFKAIGGVDKLGDVATAAKGIGNLFTKLDDLVNAKQAGKVGAGLEAVEKTFVKGTAAQKATSRALRNDWLGLTYADISQGISKAPELQGAADWFDTVKTSTKALTQLSKGTPGAKIRTIGEALAWDTFVAFNVYGEGDSEFDETLGDLAMSSGIPWLQALGKPTATYAEDGGLVRKAKQMMEGVVTGAAFNAALDMARVYQYAKNFKAASPADRAKIVEAMNLGSQEIGDSIGKTLVANGRMQGERLPGQMDALQFQVDNARKAEELKRQFQAQQLQQQAVMAANSQMVPYSQGPQVFGTPAAPDAQGLNVEQLMANQQMVAGSTEALPGSMPAGLLPEGQVQQLPGAPQPGLLPGGPEAKPPGADPVGLLGAGGGLPAVVEPVQPVMVQEIRPPSPVVTPDTIRSAFERDAFRAFSQAAELTFEEGPDGVMRSITEKVKQLMPRNRVDAMEYITTFRPAANQYGVIPAADSVWTNFIYERGLAEGWATIDPDTMSVKFNRKTAAELDRGEAGLRQAEALDEAAALKAFQEQFADRVAGIEQQKTDLLGEMDKAAATQEEFNYQQWLAQRDPQNAMSMRSEVQDRLGQMEARDAYDKWEEEQALRNAETDALKAGMDADAIDNFEQMRLQEADLAKLQGQLSDDEVVREMLGTTLDSVEPATVQKAETGRGWEVYDRNGELLGTSRTKAAAQKIADQQARRDRDALLARARQMEADGADEVINTTIGSPIYDSDIVGKIKLTDAQIKAVQGILPKLDSLLDDAWKARRGESAFFNINELGPQKRTFELSQGDMQALQEGIRRAIDDAGDLKGSPKLRALRNLADKLDTEMKLLEPQARAQRFVNDLLTDSNQYIDHGEFC